MKNALASFGFCLNWHGVYRLSLRVSEAVAGRIAIGWEDGSGIGMPDR
ncbi:hypothetical protein [Microcoleus sp. FACHB-672]|nr:hypothetical protein [Microcoleus sp. FACHB-672]MBD2040551.1 hypothetical protein [Microcoleus sp. FACHB-672]